MSEAELLTRLTAALENIERPAIPVDIALWDATAIGAYLRMGKQQVLERYAPLPDFPQAIRLPLPTGGRGHPRWKATEVIAWSHKYQERRVA